MAAEVLVACTTGSVTTAWALHLGCSTRLIGALGAMPFLVQLFQLPGAWLTSRFGARRAALWTAALSRQSFLPLVALPWLAVDAATGRLVLLAACGTHHALGILCNNAWVTWAGELVPERMRGRYFGRRTAICTLVSAASTLAVGTVLDRGAAARMSGATLAGVTALACGAGAVTVALMAQQRGGARREGTWRIARALRPFRDEGALRLGGYLVAWNAAVGFSAPFFGLYVLREIGGGFELLALYGAASAAARTLSASAWGRVVDRAGAQRVLVAVTFGLALSPFAWLAAPRLGSPVLLLEAVLGGVLLAGHTVATFTLPLKLAPAEERSHYHAALSTAGGAAFAAASVCAGAMATSSGAALPLAGRLSALQLTFAASLALRLVAAAASFGVVRETLLAYGRREWVAARREVARAAAGVLALRTKREAALAASSARARGPLLSPLFAPRDSQRWEEPSARQRFD
ncbi:MAG TPA: MFS transporter [Anaeromyxobacteraceae bacterium]|nr:MFS transporter [Anaeromyxobacteraceae bacterium]